MMSHDKLKHQVREQFLSREKIYLVAQNNFYVALVVTSYHDCKTSKCCNRCIFNLATDEVLLIFSAFVGYIIKHLFHENLCPVTF